MSDDEDYYDDDDYFFIDDGPVAEAVRVVQGDWELRPSLIWGNAASRLNFVLISGRRTISPSIPFTRPF